MNILIVEDDTAIREGVAEFLKENEYEVFCAGDGEKALEILKSKEKYDVFYDNRPVWIQEVENNNIAKVGFIDGPDEKDVYLKDLYE